MKYYIAGIDTSCLDAGDHSQKAQSMIQQLDQISRDAEAEMGKDAIILVVLQEYALTPMAISNKDKKDCLNQLQAALNNFSNMVLIPGSFAAHDKFIDLPNRAKRENNIVNNYTSHLNNPLCLADPLFRADLLSAKNKIVNQSYDDLVCLQNSTYIMTAGPTDGSKIKRNKHKKSYPWHEEKKLKNPSNSLFYIGSDNPVKKITVNGNQFEMGVIICREHWLYSAKSDVIKNNLPIIQAIISDSVSLDKNNLFGAVNIHMDSRDELSVYTNTAHPKYHDEIEIKAFHYCRAFGVSVKDEIQVQRFTNQVVPEKSQQHANDDEGVSFFKPKKNNNTTVSNSATSTVEKKPSTTNAGSATFGGLKRGFLFK